MTLNLNLSLQEKIVADFVGFDASRSYHNTRLEFLNKIYAVKKEEGDVDSVFFEFNEGKPFTKERDYMTYVFKSINKNPDLYLDRRIPKEAKRDFCFGIRGTEVKSLEGLIEKVENWLVGCGSKCIGSVPVISIDPSMLELPT
jgi:hypothetical protein